MMKKFMVLALVMAMVSLANAGASVEVIDVDGGELLPGDVVTINWLENGAFAGGFANFKMAVEAGTYAPDSLKLPVAGGLFDTMAVAAQGDGFAVAGGISYVFVGAPADDIMMTLQFVAPAPGTYAIDITGGYAAANAAGLSTTFEVVPEPMTLGLLSLGGLFLRRRK
jgi:hypothetical protein